MEIVLIYVLGIIGCHLREYGHKVFAMWTPICIEHY